MMVTVKVKCENCQHEYEHQASQMFEMSTCPVCKSQQMVHAIGTLTKNTERITMPSGNRFVEPK